MAKKRGIPQLKNWIKRKQPGPTPPQKTRLTPQAVAQADKPAFLWDEDSLEEGLEDTPVATLQTATSVSHIETAAEPMQPAISVSRVEAQAARIEVSADAAAAQKRQSGKHRKAFSAPGVFSAASSGISNLLTGSHKKSTGHTAALEFAENRKRLGRKGRRNRRIFIYAGSTLAVAVVLLLVFLVPGGAAAPADAPGDRVTSTVSASQTDSAGTTGSVVVTDSAVVTDSEAITDSAAGTYSAVVVDPTPSPTPSSTPIPTTAPDPTENPIDLAELTKFFAVEADLYYNEVGYYSNHYEYTEDDVHILAQLIYGEARGESTTGKIAVANVVMNRVLCRGAFPNTIKAVVTAPGQFTGYNASSNPSRACVNAARQVLKNELWVIPQDIYYFRSGAPENVNWGSHKFYTKIGGHCFYRHGYYGRQRGGGVPPALYDRTYKYPQFGCKPEDRVYRVQFMLDSLGYKIEKVDSYFGEGTKDALIKFQKDHNLDDDGVAGPATVKRLIEEYGIRDYFIKFCT